MLGKPMPSRPDFPSADEDNAYLHQLGDVPLQPVFIMGLHRSGTTFLYDCLARSFSFSHLNLYRLLFFFRLLKNHSEGGEERDKQALNRYLNELGIADRGLDSTAISAESVEEYGFLLRQRGGGFRVGPHNGEFMLRLCRTLMAIDPGAQAVLLKNPWDTGNADELLRVFPDARFIYLGRDPREVLSSSLNAMLSYLRGPQHYLELLLSPQGDRRSYRSGYCLWWALCKLRGLVGEGLIARLLLPRLARQVRTQRQALERELHSLPVHQVAEVDYADLVADPGAVMARLSRFLNQPYTPPGSYPRAAPRTLHPQVEKMPRAVDSW